MENEETLTPCPAQVPLTFSCHCRRWISRGMGYLLRTVIVLPFFLLAVAGGIIVLPLVLCDWWHSRTRERNRRQ